MRRHRLVSLEKVGLVLEYYGYSGSFASSGLDDVSPSGNAEEDERMRTYMIRKAQAEGLARERRMQRLRKLARMDFKMIGGVSPVGFYGGSGGDGGSSRPTNMSARG